VCERGLPVPFASADLLDEPQILGYGRDSLNRESFDRQVVDRLVVLRVRADPISADELDTGMINVANQQSSTSPIGQKIDGFAVLETEIPSCRHSLVSHSTVLHA
jgi:hypothetical protein